MTRTGRSSAGSPPEEPQLRSNPSEGDLSTQTQAARKNYMNNPRTRARVSDPAVVEREREVVTKKRSSLAWKILLGLGLSAAALAALFGIYGELLLQFLPNYSRQMQDVYNAGAPATRGNLSLPGQGQFSPDIAAGAPLPTGGSVLPTPSPGSPGLTPTPGVFTAPVVVPAPRVLPMPRVVPTPPPPPTGGGQFGERPF